LEFRGGIPDSQAKTGQKIVHERGQKEKNAPTPALFFGLLPADRGFHSLHCGSVDRILADDIAEIRHAR